LADNKLPDEKKLKEIAKERLQRFKKAFEAIRLIEKIRKSK